MREEAKRAKQLKDQNDINEHRTAQLKVKGMCCFFYNFQTTFLKPVKLGYRVVYNRIINL